MLVGVPKEIKDNEFRVGIVPATVRELILHGHSVIIENNAGAEVGFSNEDYESVGATIKSDPTDIFASADLIVKVKEPQPEECKQLRENQMLFTFLHLAADLEQTQLLIESKCSAIAYETISSKRETLPILTPMSEVAGRMSAQAGAQCLEKINGGGGILLGGVPSVPSAKVVILGGGIVGENAANIALGMGARVFILDKSIERLRFLEGHFHGKVQCEYSTADSIARHITNADLIIGAVLLPGAKAPRLINIEQLKTMQPGSVIVDVAIDQGGCFESSKPTTHANPTYQVNNIVHYCVSNMPSAVPKTATLALNNVTMPYILQIADGGIEAVINNRYMLSGLNVYKGRVTCQAVAQAHDLEYQSALEVI